MNRLDRHAIRVLERTIELGWARRDGDRIVKTKTFPADRRVYEAAMEDLRPLLEGPESDD